jgi:Ion transport protein
MFGSFFTMNLVLAVLEGSVSQGKTSDALAAEQQARKSAALVVLHTMLKGRKRATIDSTRTAVKAADTAAAATGGASKMRRQGAVRRLSIRLIDMAGSAAVAGDAMGGGDIDDISDSYDSFPLGNSNSDSNSSALKSKGVYKHHMSPVAVRPRRQTVDVCSRATSTSSMHSCSSNCTSTTATTGVTATAAGVAAMATAAVAVADDYCCEDQQHSKHQQQQQQQQHWSAKALVVAAAQLCAPNSRLRIPVDQFRALIHVMVHSPWFTNCVAALIIANTAVLASDRHPISQSASFALESLNFTFSLLFMLEMVLKLTALGLHAYMADRFNFFDAIVVSSLRFLQ